MQPFKNSLSFNKTQKTKNMKKGILLSFMLVAIITMGSCRKGVFDAGPIETEERNIDTYSSIEMSGSMDVYFVDSASYDIKIEAGKKLIPYIETRIVSGRLLIGEKRNNLSHAKGVKIYINNDYTLSGIELSGSGRIDAPNLTANVIDIDLRGSGDIDIRLDARKAYVLLSGSGAINLEGTADYLEADLSGSGDINAGEFRVADADVLLGGSGRVEVWADSTLSVNLSGSGDVRYWGSPQVNTDISGSGTVKALE